jgi:hypothetical protein
MKNIMHYLVKRNDKNFALLAELVRRNEKYLALLGEAE